MNVRELRLLLHTLPDDAPVGVSVGTPNGGFFPIEAVSFVPTERMLQDKPAVILVAGETEELEYVREHAMRTQVAAAAIPAQDAIGMLALAAFGEVTQRTRAEAKARLFGRFYGRIDEL